MKELTSAAAKISDWYSRQLRWRPPALRFEYLDRPAPFMPDAPAVAAALGPELVHVMFRSAWYFEYLLGIKLTPAAGRQLRQFEDRIIAALYGPAQLALIQRLEREQPAARHSKVYIFVPVAERLPLASLEAVLAHEIFHILQVERLHTRWPLALEGAAVYAAFLYNAALPRFTELPLARTYERIVRLGFEASRRHAMGKLSSLVRPATAAAIEADVRAALPDIVNLEQPILRAHARDFTALPHWRRLLRRPLTADSYLDWAEEHIGKSFADSLRRHPAALKQHITAQNRRFRLA